MSLFADTSALYAYIRVDEVNHAAARSVLDPLLGVERLLTHSYVIVEAAALIQRRLGAEALFGFFDRLVPALDVTMVGEELHQAAVAAFLAGQPSRISFVDRTSFEFMRRHRLDTAIAFDRDFAAEGFATLPS